jgi:hypothetical protein
MPLLSIPEATYYCAGYRKRRGMPHSSFRQLCRTFRVGDSLREGTARFDKFRVAGLREVERQLFSSVSTYRRSFDLLMASASPWSHVTMYYSSFFAASALLGMFGNWNIGRHAIIDVLLSSPGSQNFTIRRYSSTYTGAHEFFWDVFYSNVAALAADVDPALRFAISPISGSVTWQSDTRNEINYDSHIASLAMASFQSSFVPGRVPATLPGTLNTQFKVMDGLVQIAVSFAKKLNIRTDALDPLSPIGRRSTKVRRLIFAPAVPSLPGSVRKAAVIG